MRFGFLLVVAATVLATADSLSTPTFTSQEINVAKAFAESTFPITPEDLIARAKYISSPEVQIGVGDGGDCLAENFQFCGPVVGPLPKKDYLTALGSFDLNTSFDIEQNLFGFTVSPKQTNRVYWFGYPEATLVAPFFGAQPEDVKEKLLLAPQVFHMDFNEAGKVTQFGFGTADRLYGNTGGLGGAYGFFYGVGKPLPFPEARHSSHLFDILCSRRSGAS